MSGNDEEDRLIAALVECDQLLAESGSAAPTLSQMDDASQEVTRRFDGAKRCLQFLATVWPRENSRLLSSEDNPPLSPQGDLPAGDLPLGDFGRFRLFRVLSEGGMGTVYKALHVELQHVVAIKIISPRLTADPHAVARFRREIAATGAVDHPNLLYALDADELQGNLFLVLEYVDGRDLAAIVRRAGPLRVADACEVVRQAALGLDYAHGLGFVHRDVKPANLMLDRTGCVKVLDLGLALLRKELVASDRLTECSQMLGTADFMAPEQTCDPRAADARSDLYSLGCALYYLLCGHAPFGEKQFDTPGKKILAHATLPVRPIGQWRPDAPEALGGVLDNMLAKEPGDRFATAEQVAQALAPFCSDYRLADLLE
jgi:serine/threonine protein kinase